MKRRRFFRAPVNGKHYAYASCTPTEYAALKERADRDGLTISNYVRQCINSTWLEEGDDAPLLEHQTRGRKSAEGTR